MSSQELERRVAQLEGKVESLIRYQDYLENDLDAVLSKLGLPVHGVPVPVPTLHLVTGDGQ